MRFDHASAFLIPLALCAAPMAASAPANIHDTEKILVTGIPQAHTAI